MLSVFKEIKSDILVKGNIADGTVVESSFQIYLKEEIENYTKLLDSIISQLEEVILGLQGDISFTSSMRELTKVLSKGMVPRCWSSHSNITLAITTWICHLKEKIEAINKYRCCEVNTSLTLDIGAFLNKNSLFHALLSDWSRASGVPLHKMEITLEVCVLSIDNFTCVTI